MTTGETKHDYDCHIYCDPDICTFEPSPDGDCSCGAMYQDEPVQSVEQPVGQREFDADAQYQANHSARCGEGSGLDSDNVATAVIVERMNADDVRLTYADARLVVGWLGSIERAVANSTYPWSDDLARVMALILDQLTRQP